MRDARGAVRDESSEPTWLARALSVSRHVASALEPVVYSIPLSVWVNYLSNTLETETSYARAVRELGPKNLILVGTLVATAGFELVKTRREDRRRRAADAAARRVERSGQRILLAVLDNANSAISRELRIACNARYFPVVVTPTGRQLVQARDLFIEQIRMPKEYGFTGVSIDDPAIISARSYKTRTPIYEELPENHMSQYTPEFAEMIEDRQRWVLACPALSIDGSSGDQRKDRAPHGVLVFYGVATPSGRDADVRIREALAYSQKAAEAFSLVLDIDDTVAGLVEV